MHLAAHWALLLSLIGSLVLAGLAAWQIANRETGKLVWFESGMGVVFSVLTAVSAILMVALWKRDFSYEYVYSYTDSVLPLFYALTAFWAGQAGSLLFWAWMTAFFGLAFSMTRSYENLSEETRLHYWLFFLTVQAFFLLLLTGPSHPFIRLAPVPPDGKGLNPLLQNPGMIFHPPLLFMGYAGFTVPGCLALAAWATGEKTSWIRATRGVTLVSWVMLTAGIVLGCWWAYMELGWGGYWAWDPVENASLIPWFAATAAVHTGIIETRRGSLKRTNVLLMAVTMLLCFFATYLVRSGVIESLHAFGEGGVGRPLLTFILAGLGVSLWVAATGRPAAPARPMDVLFSLPGMLLSLAWLMLACALVVFLGTLWPVISKLWSANPVGLDATFYNRVCTPLFVLTGVILAFCPWLGWKEGLRQPRWALAALAAMIVSAGAFWALGYRKPVPLVGMASGVASLVSLAALLATSPGARSPRGGLGAWLLHAGLAMVLVGVAFSGPYQDAKEAVVSPGQTFELQGYKMTYKGLEEVSNPRFSGGKALIVVEKDGKPLGELTPERRIYRNFPQPFAEVSVIPSLGVELYATLLAFSPDRSASLKVSVNPLVNWFWIGGALMCVAGLLAMVRRSGEA
ncbi:Cytochrome c-type biogenesis protein CcmF [Fundidesulfovibrio magnetotacticus]|uniref:Cytochrome c-type biogenesis protein CcmF n=1 Tax=Fundidesulfovibrio magnetotacticus TaxID=2730080 RepID=A0A6V8M1E2_9BACT|nr:cytochrome c-type biogenesis CcmF C-terminal domain-containing protein [Fundidesulfovibrio magnetotacticus]GFK94275.1 Cytochrome c-type biogenesis protein CcmF [Fundidesulfovibrio magnetotacticus]